MKLEFISKTGLILPLTGNSKFKLSNVIGITVANADISSTTIASMDGDFVNNVRTMPRDITLELTIEADVENTKRYISQYVKPKQTAALRMTQNSRTTQISCVVRDIDMPRYTNQATMQISLYCSNPYWEDVDYTIQEIAEALDLHYFTDYPNDMLFFTDEGMPFGEYDMNRTKTFINDGDADVGINISIIALGEVINPAIYNSEGEYIGVNITLSAGDEVEINTEKGRKTLTLNGDNILSKIMKGSTWLQLRTGEDEFTINSADGTEANMYFTLTYKRKYI